MKNIKILLWFDVEDYATIESDDAFAELLEMLDEVGVKATIKFCAKKLDLLRERGRTDILKHLSHHELAFHTTLHSVHPLPTEYLNNYGFAAGAEEFERKENCGFYKIKEISGQHLTSYGQPGESWAPQVFPVMRKWGVPTYLDAHSIIGINGQPFWYGGVLCYSDLVNLIRLQHKDGGLEEYINDFENIDQTCDESVFISTYDHPTEFSCTVFWDEVNFLDGRNPQVLQPAPLRAPGEQTKYIQMLKGFIQHTMKNPNVEYLTASEGMKLEHQRKLPITETYLKEVAETMKDSVEFAEIDGTYLAASEIFSLMARYLTGRMMVPELLYGPEADVPSVVTEPTVSVNELAEAAFTQHDTVLGYKQLKTLYCVGNNLLNPVDLFLTMAKAIRTGEDRVSIQTGTLGTRRYVREPHPDHPWTEWILFKKDFYPENIYELARLQTWTIKPAIF